MDLTNRVALVTAGTSVRRRPWNSPAAAPTWRSLAGTRGAEAREVAARIEQRRADDADRLTRQTSRSR
jgi:hypothetical protein